MNQPYEDRWNELRREIEEDIWNLEVVAWASRHEGDEVRATQLFAKSQALNVVLTKMDSADRVEARRS